MPERAVRDARFCCLAVIAVKPRYECAIDGRIHLAGGLRQSSQNGLVRPLVVEDAGKHRVGTAHAVRRLLWIADCEMNWGREQTSRLDHVGQQPIQARVQVIGLPPAAEGTLQVFGRTPTHTP